MLHECEPIHGFNRVSLIITSFYIPLRNAMPFPALPLFLWPASLGPVESSVPSIRGHAVVAVQI